MPSRYSNVIKVQIFYSIGAQYTKGTLVTSYEFLLILLLTYNKENSCCVKQWPHLNEMFNENRNAPFNLYTTTYHE